MRPASLGLVFSMLFLCLMTISGHRTQALSEIGLQRLMYNNCLDSAIEDAVTEIVELDEGNRLQLNKSKIIEDFFTSLAVNFDAMENPTKKRLLKAYVPAIAFIEREKLTFFYGFLEEEATKEIFFQQEQGEYRIYFTLTDYVVVENKRSKERIEGDFHDVGSLLQEELFLKEELFYEEQRRVVREAFTKNMEAIIAEHNQTAQRLGIKYRFFLPVIKEEEWYRGIEKTGMIVFFQGYPYGNKTVGYYNRTAIGGAEIKKEGGRSGQ